MEFRVTMHTARGSGGRATLPAILPNMLRAVALPLDAALTAVVVRGALILFRAEDGETWDALLLDFPASLVWLAVSKPARCKDVLTR